MKFATLKAAPSLLASFLLAGSCAAGILGQAPSSMQSNPFRAITGPGYLEPIQTNSCVTNNNCPDYNGIWLTNLTILQSNGEVNVAFTIAGGSDGVLYDVFAATRLGKPPSGGDWVWMGQGARNVTYSLPTIPGNSMYLMLGSPQDSDGDGLTDEYESLVSGSDPLKSNSISPGMLDGWAVLWALNPAAIYDQKQFPNAPQVRLDHWRFNTNNYQSDNGMLPIQSQSVSLSPSWSGTALNTSSYFNWLSYPTTNAYGSSFNPSNGTIRFWYMPFHSSGPPNGANINATFFNFGAGANFELLQMQNYETELDFNTGNTPACELFVPANTSYQLQSNLWRQFTVCYTPSNVAIYTNGALLVTSYLQPASTVSGNLFNLGDGVAFMPTPASIAAGFSIGNNNVANTFESANGLIDEFETFNYPLTPQAVTAGFPVFAGTISNIMIDSDYDGRSDMLETLVDGTDPHNPASVAPSRLGFWRFDADNLWSEQGQPPLAISGVSRAPSWSGTALNVSSAPASALVYWDVYTNGSANINCRQGSLRFWFKPNWNGNPATPAPLIYLGNPDATVSHWSLSIDTNGAFNFSAASNHTGTTLLTTAPLGLDSGHWMQFVLNFGPGGTTLYTNGVLAATGAPVTQWPPLADRNLGMVIGNTTAFNTPANGQFDELETFNFQLPLTNITYNVQLVRNVDTNLDGIPDLLEDLALPVARPFNNQPLVVTGSIEAEQFDLGGPGVGYFAMGRHPANNYRGPGLFITNCDDLGLGYCLDQTRAGEWAQYTIQVLAAQNYAIDARVAGIGTNGIFEFEVTNNNGAYANTGPLAITTTNWTNVSGHVFLTNGIYSLKLRFLTNGSDNMHVGRFNYVSVYPWWPVGFASTYTNIISAAQLSTNNDWRDATNNAAVIQHAIDTLPPGGGTVLLPAGAYYISQTSPNETNAWYVNSALAFVGNNLDFAGAGKTNTTLIGYNRATTLLEVGITSNRFGACSNVTVRDLTFASQPHLAVSNVTNTVFELGQIQGGPYCGYTTVFHGIDSNAPLYNLLVSNCQFRYGDFSIGTLYYVGGAVITHCDLNVWSGSNYYDGRVSSPEAPHTTRYGGNVGIFCTGAPDWNMVITDNTYNGNANLVSMTNAQGYVPAASNSVVAPDGFIFFQSGGNYFIARNKIQNYELEAVQLTTGPSAMVGNTYSTLVNGGGSFALAFTRGYWQAVQGTDDVNYCTSFIGNSVNGGCSAVSSPGQNAVQNTYVNCSGNWVSLFPPLPQNYPGSVVTAAHYTSMTVAGNTLAAGLCGVIFDSHCTNALIMNNDFTAASYRAIGSALYGGDLSYATVLNNILGKGSAFHAQMPLNETAGWFFYHNRFVDNLGNPMLPFLDPPVSLAHVTP